MATAYDYSSLGQPITQAELDQVSPTTAKPWYTPVIVACGAVIVITFIIVIATTMAMSAETRLSAIVTSTLAFGIAGLLLFLIDYSIRQRSKYLALLNRFAIANGAVLRHDTTPAGMRGMIFDNGDNRKLREVVAFSDGREVGNYTFETGSGKNRQTHDFGYVRVALNNHLPNMVLDAKSNNFFGLTNLPDVFHASQKLSLEGDFNKYFDLYVPKEYEQDALYVFTPDVMQTLVDKGCKFDIEIVDDELFLYQPVSLRLDSEQELRTLFESVDAISGQLRDQTKRYRDERTLVQNNGGRSVALEGKRLKKGVNWGLAAIIIAVISFNVATPFINRELGIAVSLLGGAIFWVFVGFVIFKRLKPSS